MLLATLLLSPFACALGAPSFAIHGGPGPGLEAVAVAVGQGTQSLWAEEFKEQVDAARIAYAAGLEELAGWCHKHGAYASRNEALESLLHYRPDDAKARKSLRYRFDRKTDTWVRRSNFHDPIDGGAKSTAEYAVRRDALDASFVNQMMGAIETVEDNLGPAATLTELRSLYAVAPRQPRLLERLGYKNAAPAGEPPRWVSGASLVTPARRAELAEWLAEARQAAAQLEDGKFDELDEAINVEWKLVRQVESMRLVGRATAKESDAALSVAGTSLGFLSRILGEKPELPEPWTVYLLERQEDMNRYVSSYPGLDDSQRSRARKLGSMWMPGKTRVGVWGADAVERADMVCKQVAVRLLDVRYGVKTKHGWLVEALGLYVNYAVVGTRLSRHVAITKYAKPGEVPVDLGLEDPNADWLAIAAGCLENLATSDLARALGRNTSEMTSEDVALTYALVAFLCEGAEPGDSGEGSEQGAEPRALKYIADQVGSGSTSSVVAIETWFKLPLFEVQLRLQAWLQDVLKVAPSPEPKDR